MAAVGLLCKGQCTYEGASASAPSTAKSCDTSPKPKACRIKRNNPTFMNFISLHQQCNFSKIATRVYYRHSILSSLLRLLRIYYSQFPTTTDATTKHASRTLALLPQTKSTKGPKLAILTFSSCLFFAWFDYDQLLF